MNPLMFHGHNFLTGGTAGLIAMAGTFIAQAAAPVINSAWGIDLTTIGSVGVVVISGTWWLGRKFQAIEDRLDSAEVARRGMQEALQRLINEHENNHRRR